MRAEWIEWKPTRRDELISLARYGKVTPDEAEAEAKASGFAPFERQPELPAFDPMQEPRWTIVQAIAWIAWRDLKQVRENCPGFRKGCTHWLWREWNEPVENGTAFERRAGWFLENWREATTVRLQFLETILKSRDELPATWQMAVPQAEQALWHALADSHLTAEALNTEGRPVDIPAREWSYLKLYEDGKRDVLQYDALDRSEPFTDVKFRRDDLLRRWPPIKPQEDMSESSEYVEGVMLEPMSDPDAVGYVPLCVALHWIASAAGTMRVRLDDAEGWATAVAKLRPLLASGDFEVIGLPASEGLAKAVPSTAFALVNVLAPLHKGIGDILLSAPSHIDCACYLGPENWQKHFNDRLYVTGKAAPEWTHLQVRKRDILSRWPKSAPTVRLETACLRWLADQMRANLDASPKPKAAFLDEACQRFPGLGRRQFERAWNSAMAETKATGWRKAGRPKASRSKLNHRTR